MNLYYYSKSTRIARLMSGAIITAILQGPAFFSSCTQVLETPPSRTEAQIYIQWTKNPTPEVLDLFFFDLQEPGLLDSYQQITNWYGSEAVYGLSGAGAKRLVALSGKAGETPLWANIRYFGDLRGHSFSLMEDSPDRPLLCAQTELPAGASRHAVLSLQSRLSCIRVHTLSCDFSQRPYSTSSFHCDKLFLQYAGVECRPLEQDGLPIAWINPGPLDSAAVARLPHPEMILQPGCGSVGPQKITLNQNFYCYANPVKVASLGKPLTRLVLEGTIDSLPCYYPIELPGLMAGECLEMDITLLRMGSPDPDLPVYSESVKLETRTVPWDQREPYTVTF